MTSGTLDSWYQENLFLTGKWNILLVLPPSISQQPRHDHLYAKIKKQVICSDEFEDIDKTKDAIGSSRVILCTLSMLSNDRMNKSGFPELVPVETLIVDEASQVEIGDYLIPLSRFHSSLQKAIFIGDDKQCMYLDHPPQVIWIDSDI